MEPRRFGKNCRGSKMRTADKKVARRRHSVARVPIESDQPAENSAPNITLPA
jgi:hypothetical protein